MLRSRAASVLVLAAAASGVLSSTAAAQTPAAPGAPTAGAAPAEPCRTVTCLLAGLERDRREAIPRESLVVYPFALTGTIPSSATVVAGAENKQATITYAVPIGQVVAWAFTASAPLSDDAPRTSIVQLSGLANAGKVGTTLTFGFKRLPSARRSGEIQTLLNRACAAVGATAGAAATGDPGLGEVGCDLTALRQKDRTIEPLLAEYRRTAWFASLAADVGRQKFAFVDAAAFAPADTVKYGASGALTVGALTSGNLFASAGVRLENAYADADKQAVCPPASAVPQACPSQIVGGPKNTRRGVVEAEIRKYLPLSTEHPIGVSAIVRRDWEQKETSIEVPIYLIRDKKGGLSGGVSVGRVWSATPENRGPRFSVFVGQTFGLLPAAD